MRAAAARTCVDTMGCSGCWLPSTFPRSWEDDLVVLLVEALLDEGPRLDSDGPALELRRPPLVVLYGLGAMRAASSAADLSPDGMTITGISPWPLLLRLLGAVTVALRTLCRSWCSVICRSVLGRRSLLLEGVGLRRSPVPADSVPRRLGDGDLAATRIWACWAVTIWWSRLCPRSRSRLVEGANLSPKLYWAALLGSRSRSRQLWRGSRARLVRGYALASMASAAAGPSRQFPRRS